jgi:hypothetical protein
VNIESGRTRDQIDLDALHVALGRGEVATGPIYQPNISIKYLVGQENG